jgi:hypothetical protein
VTDSFPFLSGGGEAARMIRARDWSGHPLGLPETWPAEFRAALSLVLNSPESMILAWGPDLHFFFNDTYFPLLGPRLPWAMGERFDVVWADAWDQARPIIDSRSRSARPATPRRPTAPVAEDGGGGPADRRLAHDFNNLLAGISGSLELIEARIAQGRSKDVGKYIAGRPGGRVMDAATSTRGPRGPDPPPARLLAAPDARPEAHRREPAGPAWRS